MGQLEIFAGPVALDTWASLLQDAQVLHFVDNDSATACLVKGYSPQVDSCKLVGDYWLRAAKLKMSGYIDRVESKSNVADGPSRLDLEFVLRLGALFTPPCVNLVQSPPSCQPHLWFTGDQQRGEGVPETAWGSRAPLSKKGFKQGVNPSYPKWERLCGSTPK
jgi:hypothetical protein